MSNKVARRFVWFTFTSWEKCCQFQNDIVERGSNAYCVVERTSYRVAVLRNSQGFKAGGNVA